MDQVLKSRQDRQADRKAKQANALKQRADEDRRWAPVAVATVMLIAGSLVWVIGHPASRVVGALGGAAALGTVLLLLGDYFWTPKPGEPIRAPNPWLRVPAGLAAVYSAGLWILDSLK